MGVTPPFPFPWPAGFSREQTLSRLAVKAGLGPNAWRHARGGTSTCIKGYTTCAEGMKNFTVTTLK